MYEHNASGYCNHFRNGMDLFETKLPAVFASGFMRTSDPRLATIFYHPACLVDTFFRYGRGSTQYTRQYERVVLAEIDAVGFSHIPHMINALRCYTTRMPWGQVHGAGRAYPQLWNNATRFPLRVCSEAWPVVDEDRSLHLPFCPRGPTLPPQDFRPRRPISAFFMGSVLSFYAERWSAVRALNRTRGARLEELVGLAGRSSKSFNSSRVDALSDAVYALAPAGDAPDSPRIYQALRRGSVPVVSVDFRGPNFADWSKFSLALPLCTGCKKARSCACKTATLHLPSGKRQLELQRAAHEHATTFDCEPSNPAFVSYVGKALRQMLACRLRGIHRSPGFYDDVRARENISCIKYAMGPKACAKIQNAHHTCWKARPSVA